MQPRNLFTLVLLVGALVLFMAPTTASALPSCNSCNCYGGGNLGGPCSCLDRGMTRTTNCWNYCDVGCSAPEYLTLPGTAASFLGELTAEALSTTSVAPQDVDAAQGVAAPVPEEQHHDSADLAEE